MSKERKKLLHIRSSVPNKQPKAEFLEVGELAVNNAAGNEFISTKNTNDEVVRFSSDGKMVSVIEKKTVMPYKGEVIKDLEENKSQILIGLNQVAAKDTPHYDVVNGAVDMSGNPINESTDSGVTDGAGFAIDMDDYALIGGSPMFSKVTVNEIKPVEEGDTVTIYRNETTYLSGDTVEKALENLADKVSGCPSSANVVTESGDTFIYFYNNEGDILSSMTIEANDFVKDGMVESAWTETVDGDTYQHR